MIVCKVASEISKSLAAGPISAFFTGHSDNAMELGGKGFGHGRTSLLRVDTRQVGRQPNSGQTDSRRSVAGAIPPPQRRTRLRSSDLVERRIALEEPDVAWCGAVTYISTGGCKLYCV